MLPPGRVCEFRVCLPMTVEEYHVAQLWSVAEASKNETGGGEGLEVKVNTPFSPEKSEYAPETPLEAGGKVYDCGQYTHKIYHLKSKVPGYIRLLAPKGSLEIHEHAWNAYPYCRTVITNPTYMKENFYIIIESYHAQDRGDQENVHGMTKKELEKREVQYIDIANNDAIKRHDYKAEWDPTLVRSQKAERGPLPATAGTKGQHASQEHWTKTHEPVMCCYKKVSVLFKWWGLQTRVESFIIQQEKRLFTNFHRQVVCWMDNWFGLTMEDIRKIEEATKKELDHKRSQGEVQGTKADE